MHHAAVLSLLCIVSHIVFAQATKPSSKPISRYMRDAGVLYLETVAQLTLDCGKKSTADSDCMSQWESTMDGLEDRINISLNDKSRSRTTRDVPFWDLLKSTKYARKMYVIVDKDQQKAWSHAYVTCEAHAHTVALEGEYFNGDGGCEDAIEAAVHQNDSLPSKHLP